MGDAHMIRMTFAGAVALVLMVLVSGCSTSSGDAGFDSKISQMKAGTPKATVQKELGKPDEKQMQVAGATALQTDPQTVNAGSRYETWTYYRGTRQFDVVLGPSTNKPGPWVVHSVSNQPKTP